MVSHLFSIRPCFWRNTGDLEGSPGKRRRSACAAHRAQFTRLLRISAANLLGYDTGAGPCRRGALTERFPDQEEGRRHSPPGRTGCESDPRPEGLPETLKLRVFHAALTEHPQLDAVALNHIV